ncbi:MAG: undecaprenyldiphospho-muramoylpentapeptide beta-N-acetylglucosaminyltransferase [Planctomycetota bacterium]|nr:undecaprenyldiphospho-muramoylpentapeptide beta-N-acetylglucosaminyltransferase [Planctomycetota bacterium]
MRLAIAAGGTGGHLFPGLALAEDLLGRGADHAVLFLGAEGGMEQRVLPRYGHRLTLLPSLKGGIFSLDFAQKSIRMCRGYLAARRALLGFGADAVVGLGGYASALPVLAGWGIELPVMLMEQNVIPGRTTRKLAAFADEIGVQFSEAGTYLRAPGKVKPVGNPLRKRVAAAARTAASRNLKEGPAPEDATLLVLGGSQGAQFLNDLVVKAWPKLSKALPGLKVILVAGREDEPRTAAAFAAAGVRGHVLPFCDNMEELYVEADCVLARAGATSLAEIAAFALPSLLVPYPHAADDHQFHNARVFSRAGAAWLLDQKNLEAERFVQRVVDTLRQPERRRRMAQAAFDLARPEAAAEVIDRLLKLVDRKKFPKPPSGTDHERRTPKPPALQAGVA